MIGYERDLQRGAVVAKTIPAASSPPIEAIAVILQIRHPPSHRHTLPLRALQTPQSQELDPRPCKALDLDLMTSL